MTSIHLYLLLVAGFAAERLVELAVSRRNVRRILKRGGIEAGKGHFPAMAAVHTAFLAACAAEVVLLDRPFPGLAGWTALAAALSAQVLRWWAVSSLGGRWNVRIVFVPGEVPVREGPYRFLRHPNYLAVIVEIACLPLVHGAWITAIAFSLANALLLRVRIRAEEAALGAPYARAFATTPRLVPGGAP